MSRAIGSGILLNIFFLVCRGWFLHTTCKRSLSWRWLLAISITSGGFLGLFSYLGQYDAFAGLHYTQIDVFDSSRAIILLLGGLIVLCCLLYLIVAKLPQKKSMIVLGVIFIILIATLYSLQNIAGTILLGRLLVAGVEERTKTATLVSLHDRFRFVASDILFFGLISALGFAFVENIVYMFSLTDTTTRTTIGIVVKRVVTSRIMHMTFTSLIALGSMYLYASNHSWKKFLPLVLGGIALHTIFNVVLSTPHILLVFGLIIGGYFFLTRLLYKIDRVYV